jgi:hypothetical protein
MNIFLDDERVPSDVSWLELPSVEWTVVRNHKEFVSLLKSAYENGVAIEHISFDHDLADEHYKVMQEEVRHTAFVDDTEGGMNVTFDYGTEKTGYDCAKSFFDLLLDNGGSFPTFTVHSLNPVGKKRIQEFLDSAKKFYEDDPA